MKKHKEMPVYPSNRILVTMATCLITVDLSLLYTHFITNIYKHNHL